MPSFLRIFEVPSARLVGTAVAAGSLNQKWLEERPATAHARASLMPLGCTAVPFVGPPLHR